MNEELKLVIINCRKDGCSLQKCAEELSIYFEGDSNNRNYYYHQAQEEYEKLDDNQERYMDNLMIEVA